MNTREVGRLGEQMAEKYLVEQKRARILARNFTVRGGEIDLVAEIDGVIAFVEVKARRDDVFAQAREFVTTRKQERIRASAEIWLENHPTELQPRFDVIEIYAPEGMDTKRPRIIHLEDAF